MTTSEVKQINWRAPVDLLPEMDKKAKSLLNTTNIRMTRSQLIETAVREFCQKEDTGGAA